MFCLIFEQPTHSWFSSCLPQSGDEEEKEEGKFCKSPENNVEEGSYNANNFLYRRENESNPHENSVNAAVLERDIAISGTAATGAFFMAAYGGHDPRDVAVGATEAAVTAVATQHVADHYGNRINNADSSSANVENNPSSGFENRDNSNCDIF